MGYHYCVCGAGRQGVAVIQDLILFCNARKVTVCEPDSKAVHHAQKRLKGMLGKSGHERIVWCGSEPPGNPDIILSCAPWSENVLLTKMAVERGVPFCDLGGNPETVKAQSMIDTQTAIVPDCGLSPGISNILAVGLAREGCDEIHVRCGGIPERETGHELNYKLTFNPMGLLSEYRGKVPVIRNGRLGYVEALSTIEPCGNTYECSPTSNNSPQVVETLLSLGVREYDYATIRYKGHWQLVRGWKAAGFLSTDKNDAKLAAILEKNPDLRYSPLLDRDMVILSVLGKGGNPGTKRSFGFEIIVHADDKTKLSAMELTTSWGITIVASYMLAYSGDSKVPKGFMTPEMFVPSDFLWNEIVRRTCYFSDCVKSSQ